MADERTTPALKPSAVPRDVRPAFSRPPSPSEPGAEVADSHARPIAAPESAERPAITPAPATRLSSRPPPMPSPGFLPPTPPVPASAAPSFGDEGDELDERTPVSVTKPSLPFDPSAAGLALQNAPPVVVAGALDVFDPLLAPLPPPAVIEPPPGGYRTSFGSDPAPSSGPISSGRPPTSVAPPMPQIPKQVLSGRPMVHAPGIVSTQAIPLTVPARKRGRSPLFVAFAAAIIGAMIAIAIGLSMKQRSKADADGPAAGQDAPPSAAAASLAPAAAGAPSVTATATAQAAPPTPSGAAATNEAPALPSRPEASKQGAAAPAAPASRPPRKSDRIED